MVTTLGQTSKAVWTYIKSFEEQVKTKQPRRCKVTTLGRAVKAVWTSKSNCFEVQVVTNQPSKCMVTARNSLRLDLYINSSAV